MRGKHLVDSWKFEIDELNERESQYVDDVRS